jgi:hypothetical protein
MVRDRPWNIRHVSRLLVVGATATSRRRIARLAGTYEVALPARGTTVRRWLRDPATPIAGLLFVAFGSHGGRYGTVAGSRASSATQTAESGGGSGSNER